MMKIELRKMDELEYDCIKYAPISKLKEEFIISGKFFQEISTTFKNSPHIH